MFLTTMLVPSPRYFSMNGMVVRAITSVPPPAE